MIVDITVDVEIGVGVGVGVKNSIPDKPSSQETSQIVVPGGSPSSLSPASMSDMFSQTAVQPFLMTVTTACRLARSGLPFILVALTMHTRLARLMTTDLVTSILPTVMRLMDAEKDVRRV